MAENSVIIVLISVAGVVISGLGGALISSLIAPKLNNDYRIEQLGKEHEFRLKYLREEIFFKKKIEFFENLAYILKKMPALYSNFAHVFLKYDKKEFLEKIKELNEKEGKIIEQVAEINYYLHYIYCRGDLIIPEKLNEAINLGREISEEISKLLEKKIQSRKKIKEKDLELFKTKEELLRKKSGEIIGEITKDLNL